MRNATRRIEGRGTDEDAWDGCAALRDARDWSLDAIARRHRRVHVVSPHPDDELLGLGGTLSLLSRRGVPISIVGVTDGEASHPGSTTWTPDRLASERPRERDEALATLRIDARVVRLGIPDGAVVAHEVALRDALSALVDADDLVLAPWRFDGHPDHEAAARAALAATRETGAAFAEYPIWGWHWARPEDGPLEHAGTRRVDLDDDTRAGKRRALAAFRSQRERDGDRDAILPPHVIARFERSFEVVLVDR